MTNIDTFEKKINYKNIAVYEYLKVGDKVQWEGQCYYINGGLLSCIYKEELLPKEMNIVLQLKKIIS